MLGNTIVLKIAVHFIYWEDHIPPHIDLGKNKYGGPFTTKKVEDTMQVILFLLFTLYWDSTYQDMDILV